MNIKQVMGLLAIVVGIALIIFVVYGKQQVAIAKGEISDAKQKVDQGNQLFSLNPISKEVGKQVSGGISQKIQNAEHTVEYYENLFMWCQVGAVVLIVGGCGLIYFCRKGRR